MILPAVASSGSLPPMSFSICSIASSSFLLTASPHALSLQAQASSLSFSIFPAPPPPPQAPRRRASEVEIPSRVVFIEDLQVRTVMDPGRIPDGNVASSDIYGLAVGH